MYVICIQMDQDRIQSWLAYYDENGWTVRVNSLLKKLPVP
jgi:hypothetical protein